MSYVVSFIGGKGGITKTTLARATAVRFRKDEWEVGALDIDTAQTSFVRWNKRRQANEITPHFPVIAGSVLDLPKLKDEGRYHLIIVDGAAYASKDAETVATQSDLIVVPCRFSYDDMDAAVETINNLVRRGVPKEKFCLVFSGVPEQRTESNYLSAREYLTQTPYFVAEGYIEQMNSITDAQNLGNAMNEVRYSSLRAKVDRVLDAIVARLETVTSE
ncbi:hypothetical protein D0Q53_20655 [Salmonella enterica]|nr:hypothetical protein [Salmonella enterica]EFF4796138.1 ParA family protein [Escherichia coli]EBL0923942.1 hypothetical protein [Salmonella enterica]ECO7324732.1 ParA family protein [Salmonella enterica]ECZ0806979.1 ParA family protein [Salmonella enterica]